MGKSKQYDRGELLDRAVELFRRQGYNGTSTAELVTELGVNRKSMYAEFGSKQELFEAALEYYNNKNLTQVLAPLEAKGAGLDEIRSSFRDFALASEGPFRGLGCLLCNTAVERGALPTASGQYVDAYFRRLTRAFQHALNNAQRDGVVDEAIDVDEMAGFLTTALIGIAASVRAEAPSSQLWATHSVVTKVVDRLLSS